MILLLVALIAMTCIALYFLSRLDDEHSSDGFLIFVVIAGICITPSVLLFIAFDYFDVSRELIIIPVVLPILMMGFLAIWATHGKPTNNVSHETNNKNDLTAEAIILATVLSESDKESDRSTHSGGSSSSSSSSNSDDFFLL